MRECGSLCSRPAKHVCADLPVLHAGFLCLHIWSWTGHVPGYPQTPPHLPKLSDALDKFLLLFLPPSLLVGPLTPVAVLFTDHGTSSSCIAETVPFGQDVEELDPSYLSGGHVR